MRIKPLVLAVPALLGLSAAQAHASTLIINANFDSSWSADGANAAADEAAINAALAGYESKYTNSATVSLNFSYVTTGLGSSLTTYYSVDYPTYRNTLITDKSIAGGGDGNSAFLSSLPSAGNPVPGNGSAGVDITSAQARAIGFGSAYVGTQSADSVSTYDSIISLNIPTIHSDGYSLSGVASHEINEALGLGSALDGRADITGTPTLDNVGSLDFFRYSAANTRSFTSDSTATSYFSDDGGATPIVYFNQVTKADYHDWQSDPNPAGFNPQVQDAFSTPNVTTNLTNGPAEFQALNDVGYNSPSAAPEPSQLAGLGFTAFGALGLILKARKCRSQATEA